MGVLAGGVPHPTAVRSTVPKIAEDDVSSNHEESAKGHTRVNLRERERVTEVKRVLYMLLVDAQARGAAAAAAALLLVSCWAMRAFILAMSRVAVLSCSWAFRFDAICPSSSSSSFDSRVDAFDSALVRPMSDRQQLQRLPSGAHSEQGGSRALVATVLVQLRGAAADCDF